MATECTSCGPITVTVNCGTAGSPGYPASGPSGPNEAIQINKDGAFFGSDDLKFTNESWGDVDPSVSTPAVHVGATHGLLAFGTINSSVPSVVGSSTKGDIVIVAAPSTVTPEGDISVQPIDNQGKSVNIHSGYSVRQEGSQIVTCLGASIVASPGRHFAESGTGAGGSIVISSGRNALAFEQYGSPTEVAFVEGAVIELRASQKHYHPASNIGSLIFIKAGDAKSDINDSVSSGASVTVMPGEGVNGGHGSILVETAGRSTLELNSSKPEQMVFYGNTLRIYEAMTTSSEDTGTPGSIRWDDNYLYLCTHEGWKRLPLQDFSEVSL